MCDQIKLWEGGDWHLHSQVSQENHWKRKMAFLRHVLYFFLYIFFLLTSLASSSSFLSSNIYIFFLVFDMFLTNCWIILDSYINCFFFFWFNVADEIFESHKSTGRTLLQNSKGIIFRVKFRYRSLCAIY